MSSTNTPLLRGAEVVAEHLPSGYTAEFDPKPSSRDASRSRATSRNRHASTSTTAANTPPVDESESSLKLQGGDMHRDLFKMDAAVRAQMHKRAATFHNPREFEPEFDFSLTIRSQVAPGGFRRAFLRQAHGHDFMAARLPITRDFVQFLDLYGDFAGEDLADSDEEAVSDVSDEAAEPDERTSLLGRRANNRAARAARSGNSGTAKTFFTLLKAFVGTGIMFLPNAFNNGGILFSSLAMVAVAAVTMVAFHILLQCKAQYGGGYGELGQKILGPGMRGLILASIALSQLGFVCAGIVFVAENMLTFFHSVTNGNSPVSTNGFIAIQVILLIPLAWIRNISKLGPAAMIADACILFGVTYIYNYDFTTLASQGTHESVVLFNPERYTLMIGASIFAFEGIGLVLPIQSSMAKPEQFESLLGIVMIIITVVFTSVGALCYATFGIHTEVEIINNFPQASKLVNAVQFLYSVAVLVGTPVQLFPALRIMEGKIFGYRSGKKSLRTKWTKNAFRVACLAVCGLVSTLGTGNLDKFVALIGSVACVPLVYIYPAVLHYKGIATTRQAKVGDMFMIVLGIVCMIYTTTVTIVESFLR
ncbi:transmembrane amino acid transporter protein-domain-containing protein [Lasiosphaeria hispida]|uniref:Transmembrane amino acid transporter protein-domain-containing protein n=1 Tax=Lasiosphaeria hispida TaxID=260671 RepID=A0AAJ0MBJ5_9PEZI|nr:transmembrane amino acid transporter protein-domain-containing protein [Lasiosphaeria hispida]